MKKKEAFAVPRGALADAHRLIEEYKHAKPGQVLMSDGAGDVRWATPMGLNYCSAVTGSASFSGAQLSTTGGNT